MWRAKMLDLRKAEYNTVAMQNAKPNRPLFSKNSHQDALVKLHLLYSKYVYIY